MTEILCAHKWSELIVPMNETPFRTCTRCDGTWYEGGNEPEVVVARLK